MFSSAAATQTVKEAAPPYHGDDHQRRAVSEVSKNAAGYLAAIVVTTAIVVVSLQLWRADLSIPLVNDGDNLVNQMLVQGIRDNGWYLENSRLGMPLPQHLHDFPMADSLHFAIFKLLVWVFHDTGLVLNFYNLLCFPLVALSSYYVLRRFKLARLTALVASVLYACVPYHFFRATAHLFLAAYYLLPLMTLLLLRLYLGRSPFTYKDADGGSERWRLLSWDAAGAVLLCAMTGVAGAYYAFFSCFLLLVTGIKASLRDRKWTSFVTAALSVTIICTTAGVNLAPSVLYRFAHGRNRDVAARSAMEADLNGLNVAEMLLPVWRHHWSVFDRLHDKYDASPRQTTGEHFAVSIGLVASVGFLWLVGRFMWRRRDRMDRVEDGLAFLTVFAVMLGTVGGLGSLYSFYISPIIRCYNRISIWIAFFALFGLAVLFQKLVRNRVAGKSKRAFALYIMGGAGLLLLGWWDQTIDWFVPPYETTKARYISDADLGKRMEEVLPGGAMVYEMPFISFPEHPSVFAMSDYELLRPYLHTKTLRFSYGAMRGREASRWQEALSRRPLREVIRSLAFAGFEGIYLDRNGYADGGAAVEKQLTRLLGVAPLVSLDKQHVCYDMSRYRHELRRWFSDSAWRHKQNDALHPVSLSWNGFRHEEVDNKLGFFRWCGRRGELLVVNPQERPRDVVLSMACSGWSKAQAQLIIDGELAHEELSVGKVLQPMELKLRVPPGRHVLRFTCGATDSPDDDPRPFAFRVWNAICRFAEQRPE